MMKNLLAVLFVFLAVNALGLNITTRDGKIYTDAEVKKVESEGVRITHRDGTAFLDFDALPSALQKQFGWTDEKSAARKAARAAVVEQQRIAAEKMQKANEARIAAMEKAKADEIAKAKTERERVAEEQQEKRRESERAETMKSVKQYTIWALVLLAILYPCWWFITLPPRLARGKSNYNAVVIMTICGLLVLPGIGWLIALYMALQPEPKAQVVHMTVIQAPPSQPRPVAVPRVVAKAVPPLRNPPAPPKV